MKHKIFEQDLKEHTILEQDLKEHKIKRTEPKGAY
jgi:hypothetical protein